MEVLGFNDDHFTKVLPDLNFNNHYQLVDSKIENDIMALLTDSVSGKKEIELYQIRNFRLNKIPLLD